MNFLQHTKACHVTERCTGTMYCLRGCSTLCRKFLPHRNNSTQCQFGAMPLIHNTRFVTVGPCPRSKVKMFAVRPAGFEQRSQGGEPQHVQKQYSRAPGSKSDEHSISQIVLFMSMSIFLLTFRWAIDHPITLLVPLGMAVSPGVGPAVRPIFKELGYLLLAAARWIPTVMQNSSKEQQVVQPAPQQDPRQRQFKRGILADAERGSPVWADAGKTDKPNNLPNTNRFGPDGASSHPLQNPSSVAHSTAHSAPQHEKNAGLQIPEPPAAFPRHRDVHSRELHHRYNSNNAMSNLDEWDTMPGHHQLPVHQPMPHRYPSPENSRPSRNQAGKMPQNETVSDTPHLQSSASVQQQHDPYREHMHDSDNGGLIAGDVHSWYPHAGHAGQPHTPHTKEQQYGDTYYQMHDNRVQYPHTLVSAPLEQPFSSRPYWGRHTDALESESNWVGNQGSTSAFITPDYEEGAVFRGLPFSSRVSADGAAFLPTPQHHMLDRHHS